MEWSGVGVERNGWSGVEWRGECRVERGERAVESGVEEEVEVEVDL